MNDKTQEFDYIIVGAGSSGCVLASRLSEDPDVFEKSATIPQRFNRSKKNSIDLKPSKTGIPEPKSTAISPSGGGDRELVKPRCSVSSNDEFRLWAVRVGTGLAN